MTADRHLAGLDPIGWYIATSHQLLGHDKTAALIGSAPGDRAACVLCAYEADPTAEARHAVVAAVGVYWQPEQYLDAHGGDGVRFRFYDSGGRYVGTTDDPPPGWMVGR